MRSITLPNLASCHRRTNKERDIRNKRFCICRITHLLIGLMLLLASAVMAQSVVGSVTELKGIARLHRRGDIDVVLKTPIEQDDRVSTDHDAWVTITLNDGNQLRLSELTSIVISKSNGTNQRLVIALLVGHLDSTIKWGSSTGNEGYEVRTANAVVAVHGANFETAFISGKRCPDSPPCLNYTDVGVYTGMAEVSNPTNPDKPVVQVKEGLETAVPCDQPPTSPGPVGMHELGMPAYR